MEKIVTLAHGAGGKQTEELIHSIFKPYFYNEDFTSDDAAVLKTNTSRIAVTTDGFVVSPYKFKGGDIGKLSICGTVNDLACMGARPCYITCSFIIEEGFSVAELEKVVQSMAETSKEAGVKIVAGDTKVVAKGQADAIFITTTGIGEIIPEAHLSGANAKPGDAVIVTGDIGRHGGTILLERNELGIEADIKSDCAVLWNMVEEMFSITKDIHVIRDATRGGIGAVLYEIATQSNVGISLESTKIPVCDEVQGICGLLGLDPMYLANEGTMIVLAPAKEAELLVEMLQNRSQSKNARIIGKVTEKMTGKVTMKTELGTEVFVPYPSGELLPRIC